MCFEFKFNNNTPDIRSILNEIDPDDCKTGNNQHCWKTFSCENINLQLET